MRVLFTPLFINTSDLGSAFLRNLKPLVSAHGVFFQVHIHLALYLLSANFNQSHFLGIVPIRAWRLGIIHYYSGQGLHFLITQKGNTIQLMFIEHLLQQQQQKKPSYIWEFIEVSLFPKEFTKMCWTSNFFLWRLTQEQWEPLVFHTLHASFLSESSYFCELQKQHSEMLIKHIPA